ncbi:MAG: sugar ABC transporter permease [Bacillota bacterium]
MKSSQRIKYSSHYLIQKLLLPWSRKHRQETVMGFTFILPALILFLVFGYYPFYRTITISFTNWDGISSTYDFIGLDNYRKIFTDALWWKSMLNGLFFAIVAIIFMNGLALLLALAVDKNIHGKEIYKTIFYIPTILSGVVVAIIWKWLYQPIGGPINQFLELIGLENLTRTWLADSGTVLWAVSIASMWMGIGNPFLLFYAGLQGVPVELYEAARIDGANENQIFLHITLPFLIPITTVITILTLLGAMQMFNLVLAMTNGGPSYATEVPVLHIYRGAFKLFDFGYASALSVLFGGILLVISLLQMWLSRKVGVRAE